MNGTDSSFRQQMGDLLEKPGETFYVTTMENFGEPLKRVWLNESDAMRGAAGYIDVYPKSELIRLNMDLSRNINPGIARRYSQLLNYAASLIDETGES